MHGVKSVYDLQSHLISGQRITIRGKRDPLSRYISRILDVLRLRHLYALGRLGTTVEEVVASIRADPTKADRLTPSPNRKAEFFNDFGLNRRNLKVNIV